MFQPQQMLRVRIVLLQRDLPAASRALAAAGILHLQRESGLEEVLGSDPAVPDQLARCRGLQASLQALLRRLSATAAAEAVPPPLDLPGWEAWSGRLRQRLQRLDRRREELARHRQELAALDTFFTVLAGVAGGPKDLRELHFSRLFLGFLPKEDFALPVAAVDGEVALQVFPWAGGEVLLALLASRRQADALAAELGALRFTDLHLPVALTGSFAEARERIGRLQKRLRRGLETLEEKWQRLRRVNVPLLRSRLAAVRDECRLLAARFDFGYTERTVLLGGWVPADRAGLLERALERCCGSLYLLRAAAAAGEDTPVLLANPRLIRPFQKLLAVYGTPVYGEVEPTPLLAAGFVVLFGMMFGDLGQGLLLLAGGLLLRRFSRFREEGSIVAQVGVAAGVFGLLFGSFFGRARLFPPLWFSPLEDIPALLTASLALGIVLILIGLVLRIWNGIRRGEGMALLTDRFGLAGLIFYAGTVATALLIYRGVLPAVSVLWLGLPLAAIFLHPFSEQRGEGEGIGMRIAEGLVEVMETVLVYLANTFSFLRVAAFGLAHVGLFLAVFALADQVRGLPLGSFWVFLVQVAGNALILVLEGLVVSVQAVRLEFYEFFSKFFHGGGVIFRPLALEAGPERRN